VSMDNFSFHVHATVAACFRQINNFNAYP